MSNRKEILELLSAGKITADEAADLLSKTGQETAESEPGTIKVTEEETAPAKAAATANAAADKVKTLSWFRVRVSNLETGKNKVSVNIPIGMLKLGLKMGGKFSPELEQMDWKELNGMVKDMQPGTLIDVQDEESNEHVQIYVE